LEDRLGLAIHTLKRPV